MAETLVKWVAGNGCLILVLLWLLVALQGVAGGWGVDRVGWCGWWSRSDILLGPEGTSAGFPGFRGGWWLVFSGVQTNLADKLRLEVSGLWVLVVGLGLAVV